MTQKQIDDAITALENKIQAAIRKYGNAMNVPNWDMLQQEARDLNSLIPDEQPYTDIFNQQNNIPK